MPETIVRVQNGEKYYNRHKPNEIHVISDLNLELPEKGMVAIFGKSGCGKTTLLNVIGGLDKPDSGKVRIFDSDLLKNTDEIRNRYIGYVFQNYYLNNAKTVFENVADALLLCGMENKAEIETRVMAALSNVSMEKYRERHPDTLSGGQQQRVAIARALVKNPPILLADEPTGNLDETNTVMVMDILKEISKSHLVLLVTHEANLVDYYSDKVIEITDGAIRNVYDNREANGYVARNKSDIYLGELPMREVKTDGVAIEYYGEPKEEIKLQIVSVDGKIYLKSNSKSLQIIDAASEVRLKNGSFAGEKNKKALAEESGAMKDLPSVTVGKHYGRLYRFQNAFTAAWRENFFSAVSGKKKKGKRLLRVVMALLAVVSVFLSAVFGVAIQQYFDIKDEVNENVFFLPVDPAVDYSALTGSIGENGIDFAYFVPSTQSAEKNQLTFTGGNFMTSANGSVTGSGIMLTEKQLTDAKVLVGTAKVSGAGDLVITSALADEMLESSSFSYLDSYDSLLGLVTDQNTLINNRYLRIVGVVEDTQKCFYIDSLLAVQKALSNLIGTTIVPASAQTEVESAPTKGEVVFINHDYADKSTAAASVGQSVCILGKNFTVSQVITHFQSTSDYQKFVQERYGVTLLGCDAYCESVPDNEKYQKSLEWAFIYYPQYIGDFAKALYEYRGSYWGDYAAYALSQRTDALCLDYIDSFAAWQPSVLPYDVGEYYEALLYYRQNGTWPTESQAREESQDAFQSALESSRNWEAFSSVPSRNTTYYEFILADEEYETLSCSVGKVKEYDPFYVYESEEETYYSYRILIHTTDKETAAAFLENAFGDFVITPEEQMESYLSSYRGSIVRSAIALAAVLGSLCLCVYFIMRASFMSRVKEVGIQRAIGVSKGNLLFRFAVEVFVLTTLTEFLGFVFSSFVMNYLSKAALFSTIFYFPWWMAGILLSVLYAFSLFFGILPALLLLRKTPSEILAKYDI